MRSGGYHLWYLRYLRIQHTFLVLLIFCNKNRATQNKKEKQSGNRFFRHFLFSSANFFFDLRVNNRVVVIINYPHKVKTKKTIHSLINRNKQRKTAFRFACTWSLRVGRDCASHTDKQQKIELTHRYIKDLFIKFEVVERKSHTHIHKNINYQKSPPLLL